MVCEPHCPDLRSRPGSIRSVLLTILATCVLAAGCSNPSNLVLTNFKTEKAELDPDSVQVTTERLPSPPFLELGYIYAQAGSLEAAVRDARIRSARIGGTVIMNARVGLNITQVGAIVVFPVYDRSFSIRGIVAKERKLQ